MADTFGTGNMTRGFGGYGSTTTGFELPSGTTDRSTSTTGSRAAGAASIIDSIGGALASVGDMIGTIITSVGTSRALQSGNYYSRYNQGQYNSNYVGIALIAVAAVSIIVIAKK